MRSITEQVMSLVRDTWEENLISNDNWVDETTIDEIFEFLNNPKNLCTAGFILRRHIQIKFPELLKEAARISNVKKYANLTKCGNVEWKAELVNELAKILQAYKFDAINNLGIDSRQWKNLLSDESVCNRDTAIKIIFALKFDESTAAKFLIANEKNLFSTRNPFDYFCRFCLKCGFTYDTALNLMQQFENARESLKNDNAKNLMPNATTLLENETIRISQNDKLCASEKQTAILNYALKYHNEFVKKDIRGKYPSGFSRQNIYKLKIFLKYLTELYPKFLQYKEINKFDSAVVSVDIEQNADGSPKSPIHLTNAMNDGQEIYLWEINELLDDDAPPISDEDLKSYKDTLKKAQKIFNAVPFNQKIIFPLKNLSKTLRSNLRAEELPNNAKEVDHSTILFLTYFFICGCYNLKSVELNDLSLKLDTEIKNNVDDAVGNNLRYALKSVINNIEDAEDFGQLQTYVNSLDTLLESFHCSKFYPPFLVDRCVLLCLLKVRRQKNVDDFPKYLMAQLIEVSCEFSKKILKESKKISKEVT